MAGGGPPIFVPHGKPLDSGEPGITEIAFSPDGRLLAAAGVGSVRLWDLATGEVAAFLGHRSAVIALAFHPTEDLLATAGGPADATVRLWDTRTGAPAEGLDSDGAYNYSLAFSPNGTELAAASPQDGVLVWHLPSREGPVRPTRQSANVVAYLPDGRLFWAGGDGAVREADGMIVHEHNSAIRTLAFGPRESLAFGGDGGRIDVFGEGGHRRLDAHAGPVLSIALSPDADLLASAHDDGHMRIWDTGTGALVGEELARTDDGQAKSVAFSPTRDLLAAGCSDGTIRLWRRVTAPAPSSSRFTAHDTAVTSLAFSGDGSMLLSGSENVRTWHAATLEPAYIVSVPADAEAEVLSVLSNGDTAAALWNDGNIRWWKTAAPGEQPGTVQRPHAHSMALTSSGRRLFVGTPDGDVDMWHTGSPGGPGGDVDSLGLVSSELLFSPDGSLLFGVGKDGLARLVRPDSWQTDHEFGGQTAVSAAAFVDGGAFLVLGEQDGGVTTWDVRRLEQVDFVLGDAKQSPVTAMAFGAHDRSLAVLHADQRLRNFVLDPEGKIRPADDELPQGGVTAVAYSPDGRQLAIGYRNGEVDISGFEEPVTPKAQAEVVVTMDADVASRVDRLGMRREARGLARVLTARETGTPFALALLGDWGSGKSTFMNLVEAEIDQLSTEAGRVVVARRDVSASPYCAGVRQVAFNAWHYADDHLWAGLIRHLLKRLAGDPTVDAAEEALTRRERKGLETQIADTRLDLAGVEAELLADEQPSRVLRWLFRGGEARTFEAAQRGARHVRQRLRALGWIAVLVAAVGVGGVAVLAATDSLTGWVTAVCTALGVVGAATGVLHRWMITSLEGWRGQLREIAEAATLPGHEAQVARRAALTARLERLEADLAATDPERRLTRFLHDRRDSADYAAYRGLLSLVHDDLGELTDLIDQHVAAWPATTAPLTPPLQRVVLYIDDLDRCEPKRVVEVLAAIHLILAMPLFVVVVAVDPRWLLRCLRHHYVELLDTEDDDAKLGVHASTPIAYLEKIFQVAYQLPPMGAGLSDLVDTLMPLRPTEDDEESTTPDWGPIPLGERETVARSHARAAAALREGSDDIMNDRFISLDDAIATKPRGDERELDPVDTRPLDFTAEERAMVTALGPILATPRTLKRLVNVYRVVRATVAEADEQRLTDEYGYVLLLLAVALGQPLAAPWLFAVVADSRKDDLIAALDAAGPPRPSADTLPGPTTEAVGRLQRDVAQVMAGSPTGLADMATYRYWLPVVGRYSFRRRALREVGGEELVGDEALEAGGVAVDPGAAEA